MNKTFKVAGVTVDIAVTNISTQVVLRHSCLPAKTTVSVYCERDAEPEISSPALDSVRPADAHILSKLLVAIMSVTRLNYGLNYLPDYEQMADIEAHLTQLLDTPETMEMDAQPGDKVVFYYPNNGGNRSQADCARHLRVGQTYTVARMAVESCSSTVELKEFPGIDFNTVMFVGQRNQE